jgi:hypothetical protein
MVMDKIAIIIHRRLLLSGRRTSAIQIARMRLLLRGNRNERWALRMA